MLSTRVSVGCATLSRGNTKLRSLISNRTRSARLISSARSQNVRTHIRTIRSLRNSLKPKVRNFSTAKIDLEVPNLEERSGILKAATNLWETILTKPYHEICNQRNELNLAISHATAKHILKSSDLAQLSGIFIKYMSYYHALGFATPSEEFYQVAESIGQLYSTKSRDTDSVESILNDLKEWKAEIEKLRTQNPTESFRAIGKAPDPMSSCFVRFFDYLRKGTRDTKALEASAEQYWKLGFYDEAISDLKWAAECATKAAHRLPESSPERKLKATEATKLYIAVAAKLFDCGRFKAAAMAFDDLASSGLPVDMQSDSTIQALQKELKDIYQEEMNFQPHEEGCQSPIARVELRKVQDASQVSNENFQRFCVDSGYAEMDSSKVKEVESKQTHLSLKLLDRLNNINDHILKKTSTGREFPMSLLLQRAQLFLSSGLHVDALRDVHIVRSKFPALVEPAFVLSMIHSAANMAEESKKSSSLVGRLQFFSLVRRDLQRTHQWARWQAFELKLPKPSEVVEANSFVLAHGGTPMSWLMDRMINAISSATEQASTKLSSSSQDSALLPRVTQLKKTLVGLLINRALIHAHNGEWDQSDALMNRFKTVASEIASFSVPSDVLERLQSRQFGQHDLRGLWQSLYI